MFLSLDHPMKHSLIHLARCLIAVFLSHLAVLQASNVSKEKPNIIVIVADDLGYADLGCQGSKDVVSPHIDSLASHGIRCTAGYISAPQCCPSRAGLITGRYQNRFGYETNDETKKGGLPLSERTMAERLKAAGYVTGMVGKWHLGDGENRRPYQRGFDETFWHANGGVLFPDKKTGSISNLYRGAESLRENAYSTDAFGREAATFIDRHQHEPFFLYLAFVPPHWPMEAKPQHLAQFAHIPDLHRRTMLGMMASLDENVGRVLTKLRETKLEENTLIFFLSDNGGPTGKRRLEPSAAFQYGQNTSKNDPCRGVKGDLLEGGIRVPFLVQWKGRIPAGITYDKPVISLDILPTALAAAGMEVKQDWKLDGTNLLPFLAGQNEQAPHDALFWRFRFPTAQPTQHRWAIRQGDWKLVKNGDEPVSLYHLSTDIGETRNLANEERERAAAMKKIYQAWDTQNQEPFAMPALTTATRTAKTRSDQIQLAAYYFPNWGPAPHSEWNSIKAARPRFAGHVQPKIPLWGYENEQNPAVMAKKIDAAADHGLDAFIFDWYYFDANHSRAAKSPHYSPDGSRYLHKALESGFMGAANKERIKFAIMWCNHDTYPDAKGVIKPETFERLTDYVIENYFKKPTYWTHGGRPYFSIYDIKTFLRTFGDDRVKAAAALARFREKVIAAGFPGLHLNALLFSLGGKESPAIIKELSVDSVTSYTWIHHYPLPGFPKTDYTAAAKGYFDAVISGHGWNGLENPASALPVPYHVNVSMGWDSSPRCPADSDWMSVRRGYPFGPVIVNNTPECFRSALLRAKELTLKNPPGARVITINSWNEWGEGSYLEPDTVHGMKYLEAVREVFGYASSTHQDQPRPKQER